MKTSNELVTVIIPIYGVEKYLDKCILSIINQTYENLEIIWVDDGSPDNCPAICDQYAKKDSRIRVIHKINGGLSSARNAGLDIATGKYVSFVDSDDSISGDYIDVLYNALKNTNSQISVGNILTVNSDKIIIENDLEINESLEIFSPSEAVMNMYKGGREGLIVQFITVWGNLYDIELFKILRFPFGKNNEDEFLNYRLFFLANSIVYSPKKIYYYLVRENSIMQSEYSLSRLVIIEALEERILFFDNVAEMTLKTETMNYYYHYLIAHLNKVKKQFPHEKLIYSTLLKKYRKLGRKLLFTKKISFKRKLIVIKYQLFPNLHKLRL
jgi:glycosyltransferase involved in cell wall biosynthesis